MASISYIILPAYGSPFFQDPFAVASFPTPDRRYTIRFGTDTNKLYYFDGTAWQPVTGSNIFSSIFLTANTNQIVLGTGNTTTFTMAALSGNRIFTLPNADSNSVIPATASAHNFVVGISSGGVISFGQPAFTDLTGTATNNQLPTILSSKTFDNSNTYVIKDGSLTLENTTDVSKIAVFDLSNIATSTSRTINVPNANSTLLQASTAPSHQFATGFSAQGVESYAQPAFSDISGTASLTTQVTGVLPVANGGTNSSTALNSNRFITSSGGKIVEAAAVTASRAVASDVNGLPVASATTATELGFVNGVTSAIQTQINGKEPTITAGTSTQYWRGDKTFQTLNIAALLAFTDGSSASASQFGELLTTTQASLTTTNVGTTGVYGYVTSQSVTAGRWIAWGSVQFNQNAAVLTDGLQCGISASTSGSGLSAFDTTLLNGLISSTSDAIAHTPLQFITISSTTTYYLNTKFTYTSGTPKHAGKINFFRIG